MAKIGFFGGGWRQVEDVDNGDRTPIIDAHFHIFPRFGTGSGPGNDAFPLKLWQYHLRDFTDFWRKSDGKRVKQKLLDYPSDSIHDIPEVNFRMGRNGQAELTVDGVDYIMQMYPASLENLDATPERMIAEMNAAGVDMGVLQSDHVYGSRIDEYYCDAMPRHPGRFIALAQIWEPDAPRLMSFRGELSGRWRDSSPRNETLRPRAQFDSADLLRRQLKIEHILLRFDLFFQRRADVVLRGDRFGDLIDHRTVGVGRAGGDLPSGGAAPGDLDPIPADDRPLGAGQCVLAVINPPTDHGPLGVTDRNEVNVPLGDRFSAQRYRAADRPALRTGRSAAAG